MKTFQLSALLAAALAVTAPAPASALDETVVAHWSCETATRPSQREVAAWFGIANFDQAYDVRARTHLVLQRACARGARGVDVVQRREAGAAWVEMVAQR